MLTKVSLEGALGVQFGPEHHFDIECPADVISALVANYPEFSAVLWDSEANGVSYQLYVGDHDIEEANLRDLHHGKPIVLIPVFEGSGTIGKIITGVALLGLGLSGVGIFGITAANVALLGGAMALGGISELLTPRQKPSTGNDKKSSFSFSGAINTEAAGNPVPLLYGRFLIGSQVISAGVTTYAIAV